jgi:gas vesicle protein
MAKEIGAGSVALALAGVGVGVVAGLLLAPKAGKELRSDIAEGANHGADQVSVSGKKLNQRLGKVVAQAQDRIHEAVEAGEKAFDVARSS